MTRIFSTTRLLPNLAALVAAVVFGFYCIQLANHLLQNDVVNLTKPDKSVVRTIEQKSVDYSQLAQLNLFGKAIQDPNKEEPIIPIEAPETRLKLVLMGIFYSSTNDKGYAIISEQGKPQKTYQSGDTLPNNARLFAVEKDRVILERNSRYESLRLIKLSDQLTNNAISDKEYSRLREIQQQDREKDMQVTSPKKPVFFPKRGGFIPQKR